MECNNKAIVIDLGMKRKGMEVNESTYRQMGASVEYMMNQMFGGSGSIPVKIKGTSGEIAAFAEVMRKEKKYMKMAKDLGLDNPMTYKTKYELNSAISEFERKTGLDWIFR